MECWVLVLNLHSFAQSSNHLDLNGMLGTCAQPIFVGWAHVPNNHLKNKYYTHGNTMEYRRIHQKGGTYFFTLVTHNRQPIFANPTNIRLLKNAIHYTKSRHPFTIDAIVILPDHIHCLWTLPDENDDNAIRWMLIKSHLTRNLASTYKNPVRSASRKQKREQP